MTFTLPHELQAQAAGWVFSRWLDKATDEELAEFLTHLDYYRAMTHAEQARKRRDVTVEQLLAA